MSRLRRKLTRKDNLLIYFAGHGWLDRDDGRRGHSVFAAAFLEAREENTGVLEGTRLFNQIRQPVILNAPQTPEYSDIQFTGHEGGDFLFIRIGRTSPGPPPEAEGLDQN